MRTAAYWKEHLALEPHPEGGCFRETYRSGESIAHAALPVRFAGNRSFCTSIFYLLEADQFSAFHRIRSDELWHFYDGGTLEVIMIDASGDVQRMLLGRHADRGEVLFGVVPAGCWFGSRLVTPAGYALVGCTVAPGFDFADFEIADREALLREFPQQQQLIHALTRT